MTQTIYWDGTDQYLLVRLGSVNTTTGAQSILTGSVGGESLQTQISDIVVVWAEYKQDGVPIDTDIAWDGSVGMWKVPVPDSVITQYGKAMIIISGHDESTGIDIISTVIEIEVISAGVFNMGSTKIITSYEFDASNRQITITDSSCLNLKLEQIISIRNITKRIDIYDSSSTRRSDIESVSSGDAGCIIIFGYRAVMSNDDVLQIVVNTN